MPTSNPSLPLASFVAAVLAASATTALAQTAGQATGLQAPAAAAPASSAAALDRAAKQLSAGRLVEARALLLELVTADESKIGDEDRRRAASLLNSTNRRLKDADHREVTIQKSEFALAQGDVRTATLHAGSVLEDPAAEAGQRTRAQALLDAAASRRAELTAVVPEMLAQAERDFAAGRVAEAKAAFDAIYRSGVELDADQQASLDKHQTQIVLLERSDDKRFGLPGSAGMLQPGTIVRRDEQPATEPPAEVVDLQPGDAAPATPPAAEGDVLQQAMRIQAQADLAQANQAYEANRLNEAVSLYNRVLSEYRSFLTPEQLQQAQTNLTNAQLEIQGQVGAQGGILEEFSDETLRVRNQTLAEFNNLLQQARAQLGAGNVQRARELALEARLSLGRAATYFRESEYEDLQAQADGVLNDISARERAIVQAETEQAARERERIATEAARRRATERERQINELIDRARAYQAEMRYEEALQAVDQLLFLNPVDPAGLLLKDILTDIIFYRKYNAIQQQKNIGFAVNSIENQEASVPPPGLINFPPDWPAISFSRGEPVAFNEPPENRAVLAELDRRRIPSVRFTDNALEDVVEFVGAITQLNIDVDWPSLELAGVQRETPISLNLTNVTAKTLLDRVVEKASGPDGLTGVDWAINDGIVTIASEEAIRRNTTLLIYDISDLLIEVPDYADVPEIDLASVLQSGQGGGGQSPFQENQQQQREEEELRREERMDEIVSIITENIDFEGWIENGGDTGKIQRLDRSLIITNTPKNHRQIAGLLSKLREIRAMQINVETRFLLVNQDWFEQIGFDIDVILNANNNQVRTAQSQVPTARASDFFGPSGRLNRVITSPAPGVVTGGPVPNSNQAVSQPAPWSPVGFNQDSLGLASGIAPSSDWANSILGSSPALGIAGQFLDDIQVDFLIQATQADRRSIQLTAPRLTFTNGQIANIYVVTQQAFVSDLQPIVGESAVGFDPEIETVSEGVTLLVEGTVTADRRYVTMNVDAGVSRIDSFAQQAVTAVAGGQLVSSQDTQSFIQLPTVTVTRVRTTVTVPDQGTLLLGGQRLVTEFEVETGVPVLSKLPILNRFFTNRIESKEEQTLLILIKPTILIMTEEEERNFPGLPESLRGGVGG